MFPERQAGVTLIELMVVVGIAAIMATIAAPSFSAFIQDTRLTSTMTLLTGDLNRARNEAIKRNSRVLFCAREINGLACSNTTWDNGWLICYDNTPQDGACDDTVATDPNPLLERQAIHARLDLTGIVTATGAATATIRFNPSGTTNEGATLALCCKSAVPYASSAVIAVTGHISKL